MAGRSGYGYTSTGTNDFGESFIEVQRQHRFRKLTSGPPSRARSEVAEVLAYGNGPSAHNSWRHRRESSYREEPTQSALMERPRSSFEPAASSRLSVVLRSRPDDWYEVERKVNDYSSEEELELDSDGDDDSREEMARYHFKQPRLPTHTAQGNSYLSVQPLPTQRRIHQESRVSSRSGYGFDPNEVYYFGVIHLSPEKVQKILATHPPPYEYRDLTPIERAAYLFYFTLYRKYFQPMKIFHRVFNREFYKYTCEGDSEDIALWKICKHTQDEYKQRVLKRNQQAYDLSQKHLFSDERGTPDSRASDPSRLEQDSDIVSVDSISKEPLKFRVPHAFLNFSVGGRVIYVNPENSVSTIRMDDMKTFIKDRIIRRNIEALESFKGPLRFGETQTQTPLLFIQRQIDRILQSDVYRGNPASSDANDCLLIWRLLEMLIRQHGRVTGPDLANLLTRDYSYSSVPLNTPPVRGRSDTTLIVGNEHSTSNTTVFRDERYASPSAVDKYTQFLLLGLVDEAIDCAMNDGLFFDALILAYRMFKNDLRKLEEYEAKLLARRPQQHPTMTLIHVAAQTKVPILTNTSSDDASGWRAHIAIVLANLHTEAAIDTVYQLGLELARKEFNSAADFCFLAVNLLNNNFDAFRPPPSSGDDSQHRRHIKLINSSLPDDEFHSTHTRFGWSITDFQATEIYDYALKLASNGAPTMLSSSGEFQKCRVQYAQMLAEYGGFNKNAFDYSDEVARAIWAVNALVYEIEPAVLKDLCDLAERLKYTALPNGEDPWFVVHLRTLIDQIVQNQPAQQQQPVQPIQQQPQVPIENETTEKLIANFTPGATSTPNITANEDLAHHQNNFTQLEHNSRTQGSLTDYNISSNVYHPTQTPHKTSTASNGYQNPIEQISPIHSTHKQSDSETPTRASSMSPRESITTDPGYDFDGRRDSLTAYHHGQNLYTTEQQQQYIQYQQAQQTRSRLSSRQRSASESSNTTLDGISAMQIQTHKPIQNDFEQPYVVNQKENQPTNDLSLQRQHFNDPRGRLDSRSSEISRFEAPSMTQSQSQPIISKSQPLVEQRSTQPQPVNQAPNQIQPAQQQQTQGNKNASSSGGTSWFKKKIMNIIPGPNQMKLPDDSNPSIRWDPVTQKWIGEEVEEEHAPPPPPAMSAPAPAAPTQMPTAPTNLQQPSQMQSVANGQINNMQAPVSSLQAMRRGASSRYRNVLEESLGGAPAKNPMLENPLGVPEVPPLPPTFGFIPTAMDSGEADTSSPFSPFSEAPAGEGIQKQVHQ